MSASDSSGNQSNRGSWPSFASSASLLSETLREKPRRSASSKWPADAGAMPLSAQSVSPRAFLGRQLRRLRKFLFPALRHPDALGRSDAEAGLDLLYRF